MKIYSTIIKPITTEKSSNQQAKGQYTFLLSGRGVTKIDVKHAVEAIYGVKVKTVRTIVKPAKTRSVGRRTMIKKRVRKIAIVTLKDNKTIDPNKISDSKSKPKSKK